MIVIPVGQTGGAGLKPPPSSTITSATSTWQEQRKTFVEIEHGCGRHQVPFESARFAILQFVTDGHVESLAAAVTLHPKDVLSKPSFTHLHGLKNIPVSVTPELVQILRQSERASSISSQTLPFGSSPRLRQFGERLVEGRYQLTLSITNMPPGRILWIASIAQRSRYTPSTKQKSRLFRPKASDFHVCRTVTFVFGLVHGDQLIIYIVDRMYFQHMPYFRCPP